jgi:hypothetical protein
MAETDPTARDRCLLVFCAVRRAALVLGADTISEHDYERARAILHAAGPQDAGLRGRLPHARRLKRIVGGDWQQVLRVALLPTPAATGTGPQTVERVAERGMAVAEAIAWFWQVNRQFPSRTTLERFMAACDARLTNPQAGVAWHHYLDHARELLRQQGHAPDDRPPRHGRPVRFTVPPDARIPGALPQRHNRRHAVTHARCVEALRRFSAEQRATGQPVTRAHYLRWRRGTRWPAPSSMSAFGGFSALRERADG